MKDEVFAREFLTQNGITHLTNLIGETTGNTLAYALGALQEAMSYGWDSLSSTFISKVVTFVDSSNINVCKSALELLIHLSNNPKHGYSTLETAFKSASQKPFANLVHLLVSVFNFLIMT